MNKRTLGMQGLEVSGAPAQRYADMSSTGR
jgi:hypothetical protein